ncbi:choice-of-anchor U domain-containing protein [Litorilituus lipolyticus]|uniref:Uncharacterized protein n=1 Tax=Litorilituus lipolyticus TaxID=2491017 RepID=A0A502L1S6_9GAMM|nr:choice-of-anchor U domain-containing protein [Litorilituus lipolyticus]TPH16405.1 hypothetical protein EPA86_06610 [Litorilituus lipolyticus]
MALSQLEIDKTGRINQDSLVHQGNYFDFEIHDIQPFGKSAYIVFPLAQAIAEHAVYRKYTHTSGWNDFKEDSKNTIATSETINGVCPAPHNEMYQAGLNVGHLCLRLFIEDGGVNDNDGIANGVIVDPGGIAIVANSTIAKETTPEKSSSGSFAWWLMLLIIANSTLRNKRTC